MEKHGELPRASGRALRQRDHPGTGAPQHCRTAEVVEKVDHLPLHRALPTQAGEQFRLGLLHVSVDAGPGRELLGHELAELAELHKSRYGVGGEIGLRASGYRRQHRIVPRKKAKVRRFRKRRG